MNGRDAWKDMPVGLPSRLERLQTSYIRPAGMLGQLSRTLGLAAGSHDLRDSTDWITRDWTAFCPTSSTCLLAHRPQLLARLRGLHVRPPRMLISLGRLDSLSGLPPRATRSHACPPVLQARKTELPAWLFDSLLAVFCRLHAFLTVSFYSWSYYSLSWTGRDASCLPCAA